MTSRRPRSGRWPTTHGWFGPTIVVSAEERGNDPRFGIDSVTGAVTRLGPRTGSWDCVEVIANGRLRPSSSHGEKGYRVPIGEGLALFEALQRQRVDSELVVFPDENHWIMRPRNIASWYDVVLDFIERHLADVG